MATDLSETFGGGVHVSFGEVVEAERVDERGGEGCVLSKGRKWVLVKERVCVFDVGVLTCNRGLDVTFVYGDRPEVSGWETEERNAAEKRTGGRPCFEMAASRSFCSARERACGSQRGHT